MSLWGRNTLDSKTQGGCKSSFYIDKVVTCGMKGESWKKIGFYLSEAERCKSLCLAELADGRNPLGVQSSIQYLELFGIIHSKDLVSPENLIS